ncbi:hypothetical protein EB796_007424 [Bugula neritina]|uniref:Uncharacterized protein n=1 Tax=Bugula neritina TaxID=10212 RepID=A0A7J7K8L1_BUGNE|nr:hypothetical protein EB796_007424 [Bugula neritina]
MSIGKALSPPGIIIPKHGYYGLSEGDIPGQVARCDSDVSVNTILSEEHLLAEYVHDMSLEIYEQNKSKDVICQLDCVQQKETVS